MEEVGTMDERLRGEEEEKEDTENGGVEIEEQGDEGSEEEEEEELEDEEALGFMFESGKNPFDVIDDASSLQVFRRMEQMEYEALAEKKRKASAEQPEGSVSGKKPRIEDASAVMIDVYGVHELWGKEEEV